MNPELSFIDQLRSIATHPAARGLLDDVELAIILDLADQHRLGDVVVRHDGGVTARKVRHGNADDRVENLVRIRRAGGGGARGDAGRAGVGQLRGAGVAGVAGDEQEEPHARPR